jgi:murein DD-endopeptidase MepM/ murein hydrolase activator NlpD
MDRKIRIYFFPRDASRVRAIVFSRRMGLFALFASLPLCLLGVWLVVSGHLREDDTRRLERTKLEREASALNEKTGLLQKEIEVLRRNLDSLESIRISVTLSSGLETQREDEEAARDADRGTLSRAARFSGLVAGTPRAGDFAAPLNHVRGMSRFLDSTLIVLTREADLAARLPTLQPVAASAIMTRGYGPARDPFTGRKALHAGADYSLPPGSPVRAAGGGTVTEVGNDPLWGYYVRIRHTDRVETFYSHLQGSGVASGRTVARGEIIGWLGQSGATTGPHLHFEMRVRGERVDPLPFLITSVRDL